MGTTTTNYGLYKPAIGETGWGALRNTSYDTIDSQVFTNETAVALNTTHRTSDGSDHTFIDQDVTSGVAPTFVGTNFTGLVAATVGIIDSGALITATDVEDALQENRTAINLNTTHASSDGSQHTFIDQSVVVGASPTFDGNNFTGMDADDVDIADAGVIITATDVEGALQENRTAIDLNTTHAGTAAPHRTIDDNGVASTDLWSAAKISSVVQGIDWKESVIDFYDPTASTPPGPGTGDRYISTATANGWTDTYIYEYNGATWDETIPTEGAAVWNETEDTTYTFNGAAWVKFGTTVDHLNLQNIGTNSHAAIDSHISGDGSDHSLVNSSLVSTLNFVIDGGGSAITTGIKGDIEIPFACTINQVTLLADQSTTTVIDIWKDTYANYPATDADSITAAAVPTITAALKSQDSTLTAWTTSITAGDCLRFNVDSTDNAERITISLKVTKT